MRTPLAILTLVSFLVTSVAGPLPIARSQEFRLPIPGVMVHLSPPMNPPILKGIKVHPENPFRFDFILDKGDGPLSNDALHNESTKLIKYFLASLTIPEKDLWVNQTPKSKLKEAAAKVFKKKFGLDLPLFDSFNIPQPVIKAYQSSQSTNPSPAMKTVGLEKGGIDLTPANMNLQTQNAGGEIKFHMDPAMLQQLQNAPGFVPVIINISPMSNLKEFLGIVSLDSPS